MLTKKVRLPEMYIRTMTFTLVRQRPAEIEPKKIISRTKTLFFSLKEQYFLTMINYENVDLVTLTLTQCGSNYLLQNYKKCSISHGEQIEVIQACYTV